jgi:carbonic anhydrase/acetyltransferase-like protein (isoleucine patch superfamily)
MRIPLGDAGPQVDPSAWLAPDAVLVGDVSVGPEVSVWFTAVLRADGDPIRIGARSNIQDGCVLHTDPGLGIQVGSGVSVGHRAILHGCVVEDDVLVGMGSIVMNGARIGSGSLVAAGAVVTEGTHIPAGSVVVGSPARVRRQLTDDELVMVRYAATHYIGLAQQQRQEFAAR